MSAPACRNRLPDDRHSITKRLVIRGAEPVYLTVGFYPSGEPAEIFLDGRMGDPVLALADAAMMSASLLLQTGTSLEVIVSKWRALHFEPAGLTDDPDPELRECSSILDYAARWLDKRLVRRVAAS